MKSVASYVNSCELQDTSNIDILNAYCSPGSLSGLRLAQCRGYIGRGSPLRFSSVASACGLAKAFSSVGCAQYGQCVPERETSCANGLVAVRARAVRRTGRAKGLRFGCFETVSIAAVFRALNSESRSNCVVCQRQHCCGAGIARCMRPGRLSRCLAVLLVCTLLARIMIVSNAVMARRQVNL